MHCGALAVIETILYYIQWGMMIDAMLEIYYLIITNGEDQVSRRIYHTHSCG